MQFLRNNFSCCVTRYVKTKKKTLAQGILFFFFLLFFYYYYNMHTNRTSAYRCMAFDTFSKYLHLLSSLCAKQKKKKKLYIQWISFNTSFPQSLCRYYNYMHLGTRWIERLLYGLCACVNFFFWYCCFSCCCCVMHVYMYPKSLILLS